MNRSVRTPRSNNMLPGVTEDARTHCVPSHAEMRSDVSSAFSTTVSEACFADLLIIEASEPMSGSFCATRYTASSAQDIFARSLRIDVTPSQVLSAFCDSTLLETKSSPDGRVGLATSCANSDLTNVILGDQSLMVILSSQTHGDAQVRTSMIHVALVRDVLKILYVVVRLVAILVIDFHTNGIRSDERGHHQLMNPAVGDRPVHADFHSPVAFLVPWLEQAAVIPVQVCGLDTPYAPMTGDLVVTLCANDSAPYLLHTSAPRCAIIPFPSEVRHE